MRALLILPLAALLTGCVVRTAANVATLPVRAASQGVDWATTSQDEADRNRGRRIRHDEEQQAKEQRRRDRDARREAERQQEEERRSPY